MAEASSTIENGPAPIRVGGAPEGFDAALLLREAGRGDSPVLHIARDDKRAEAMARALAFFDPTMPVLRFPGWDCLPYDRVSPNPEVSAARMATLATLAAGLSGRFILLTTLNAATQYVPARDLLRASAFVADVGGRIDEGELRSFLVRMGFVQTPTVTEPGDYAVRGGIIDVWPPGEPTPVRLDLFGDVLDGARRFDAVTQRTTETLDRVELAPVSEVILDEAAITRFRQNYRIEFGAAGTDDPLYEAVSAGRKHQGAEHWLPFFHERLETLFDYLPGATVTLDDQTTPQRIARWEAIADQYDTRATALSQKGRLDTVYKPVPPGQLYLDEARGTTRSRAGAWCSSRRCRNRRPGRDRRGRARGPRFRARTPEREPQPFRGLGGSSSHASGGAAGGRRLLVRGRAGASEGASGGSGPERPAA
jgi:transcription-repair coupling factor (superfamily II helicase)